MARPILAAILLVTSALLAAGCTGPDGAAGPAGGDAADVAAAKADAPTRALVERDVRGEGEMAGPGTCTGAVCVNNGGDGVIVHEKLNKTDRLRHIAIDVDWAQGQVASPFDLHVVVACADGRGACPQGNLTVQDGKFPMHLEADAFTPLGATITLTVTQPAQGDTWLGFIEAKGVMTVDVPA